MYRQLQPPVPLASLVKTEPPTVIKIEPSEDALEKEISLDIKNIDIAYHSLSEHLIKSETVPENIIKTKYSESVETQVLVKTEDQEVIEVEGSHEHSNTLSNLETHEQLVLDSSKDLNCIDTRTRKTKHYEKTNFYKSFETTSWKEDKEKIKVIKAPVIPVEAHEYTSLAEDKYVCNHCQHACNKLTYLRIHIRKLHRKVTTMYQCPYCPYKSKWKHHIIKQHIILKHKNTKDIQRFQCNLCEIKFKLKGHLTRHMKVHLRHKQIKDGLDLRGKRYCCDKCSYKTDKCSSWKNHKLIHLKPEEIQYFYCYHCSYKSIRKVDLKKHIFKHFKNEEIRFHCYICDFVRLKRDLTIEHIKKHFKNRQLESRISNFKKRVPNNLEDDCKTIHFDDQVNHIKKQKSERPESTKSFVSRTESVPENSLKSCIFQCTYCPTKFPEEHLLKGHLQLHSNTKGIECPICTYRHNKTEILKHLSWHGANGKDPFICPICDLKKRTKENMDDHLKVVHSKAIYQKHDSVCKKKICNGFCQITIGGKVDAE